MNTFFPVTESLLYSSLNVLVSSGISSLLCNNNEYFWANFRGWGCVFTVISPLSCQSDFCPVKIVFQLKNVNLTISNHFHFFISHSEQNCPASELRKQQTKSFFFLCPRITMYFKSSNFLSPALNRFQPAQDYKTLLAFMYLVLDIVGVFFTTLYVLQSREDSIQLLVVNLYFSQIVIKGTKRPF